MAREVLSNGVIVPEKYTRDWFDDFRTNLVKLNDAITAIAGKQNALTQEQLDAVNSAITSQKVTAYDDHIADTSKHLTDGTASKAIADEDGTSIKTGYVNVAGDQTVGGKKTWTGSNTFNQTITIAGQSGIWLDRKAYTAGILPSSTLYYGFQNAYESGGSVFDRIRSYVSTTGTNLSEHVKYAWNNLTKYASVTLWISADGSDSEYKYNTSRVIPATNNAVSLGSSSYQWSSVYAQSYFYNGTQWGLDQANTWTGNNIFNKNINPASVTSIADTTLAFNGLFNTIFLNTRGSSNRRSYGSFLFVGYGSASGADNYGQIQLLRSTDKRGDTNEGYVPDTSFKLLRVNPHSLLIDFMENVRVVNDGTDNYLAPITTNVTDLGTSTNKWKTLNGVNPGALSLPGTTYTNIDTTGWSVTGAGNTYTPTLDGWVYVRITSGSGNYIAIKRGGSSAGYPCDTREGTALAYIALTVPVSSGQSIIIGINGTIEQCRFIPCLGNV